MGEFSPDWLTLREPFDHAARDVGLLAHLQRQLPPGRLRVVDLACGLGSSLRYLAPRLSGAQHWTLIDHDPVLLDRLGDHQTPPGVRTTIQAMDLRTGLADLPLAADLVVTSALLDLVSVDFLVTLSRRIIDGGLPLLAVLSVDGRVALSPPHPADSDVMRWFRAHQHTDRGFGPSPGVAAVDVLAGMLEAGGMTVYTAAADWQIGPEHPDMLAEMIRGIAGASAEMSPRAGAVAAWQSDRLAAVDDGRAPGPAGAAPRHAVGPCMIRIGRAHGGWGSSPEDTVSGRRAAV